MVPTRRMTTETTPIRTKNSCFADDTTWHSEGKVKKYNLILSSSYKDKNLNMISYTLLFKYYDSNCQLSHPGNEESTKKGNIVAALPHEPQE
jgi:hypothetical protein